MQQILLCDYYCYYYLCICCFRVRKNFLVIYLIIVTPLRPTTAYFIFHIHLLLHFSFQYFVTYIFFYKL